VVGYATETAQVASSGVPLSIIGAEGQRNAAIICRPACGRSRQGFEDRILAGRWKVENVGADGNNEEVKVFTGLAARQRAIRYAANKYAVFEVMRRKPHQRRSIPA
jgi:hypothetical protein